MTENTKPEAGQFVLAWLEGLKTPIRAMWVPPFHLELAFDQEPEEGEYSEEKDEYFCREGWYEANRNDETYWRVDLAVIAWAPLPAMPTASSEAFAAGRAATPQQNDTDWVTGTWRDDPACPSQKQPHGHPQAAGATPQQAIPETMLQALRFYANGDHLLIDEDKHEFDTVSGEPQNWLMAQADDDVTMLEDGGIARAALQGKPLCWIEDEDDATPAVIAGEVFAARQVSSESEGGVTSD